MIIGIIEALKAEGVTIRADGDFLELSPAEKITKELIERLKKHKPAILAELKRQGRYAKVLAILTDNPETKRAIITDMDSDPDNVIITIVIRNQYTFEMMIPKAKYDPFTLLELINKGSLQ
ncbi:hypothetical protein [Nitrosomonas sp. Nm166]|uniref:TubC N-terminal docking domain-related protein n=1 Tax=Nitrosomonas sp. Nm166 TaxID=1881054 RepID=UPI0008E40921|nr:hypothetical protein [Nitrosomonas sp. Nm166]SFE41320.1 hypothetical protein SAMN05428977_101552 [Nitrosomonas sp. Nm166]